MIKFTSYALPVLILLFVSAGVFKKINVFEAFKDGALKGIKSLYKIVPYLIAIVLAIKLFRSSGLIEIMSRLISPLFNKIGIPSELVPMALLKPISGSGSTALLSDMFKAYGTDSKIGLIASVMCCSSETTFYTIAVYYGSCGIKNIRHTVIAAVISDISSVIFSVLFVNILLF